MFPSHAFLILFFPPIPLPQRADLESLKAKLAGLHSELSSLRTSHATLLQDLETERVEKGELVAAAEQMLAMCGEKIEELQQEDIRRSTAATPRRESAQPDAVPRSLGGAARPPSALGMNERGSAGSGVAKPSGLRAPGGFGFQAGPPALGRTASGKSRLLSNIERMGGRKE